MNIINFGSTENMDNDVIPEEIYNLTIQRETLQIQNYFITHLPLMYSFVGFNGALKLSNQLNANKKCGCFYTFPWKTHYNELNGTVKTILLFSQQVDLYRYMINFSETSNMKYLSTIALSIIQDISLYLYYISNNLDPCFLFQKKWYKQNFTNIHQFRIYIMTNMIYVNPTKNLLYRNLYQGS
jgi:hypothetical protein